ncbi:MAG: glycosyltransferase, partial [Bacteroidales bacterium]|nr:glycosyltransferase [Bacteroidales bacterium]
MAETPDINILVPLYNEKEVFDELILRLNRIIESSIYQIEVILVDDGSSDGTKERMKALSLSNKNFQSIFLSRNFGQHIAITAGLKQITATQVIMIMDGDLQDPPEMLDDFFEKYKNGYDVVYAIRNNRKENLLLKLAYSTFYYIMKKFSYIHLPLDSGDFSLISRRVADHINSMPEEGRFFRGMRAWVGFKQIGIPYNRDKRNEGSSKYSLKKLVSLA